MLTAHKLALLAISPRTGALGGAYHHVVVAAALLHDLELSGRVAVDALGRVQVMQTRATGQAHLDVALDRICTLPGQSVKDTLQRLFQGRIPSLLQLARELGALGVLRAQEETLLWVFTVTRFREANAALRAEVVQLAESPFVADADATPHGRLVGGLAHLAGIGGVCNPHKRTVFRLLTTVDPILAAADAIRRQYDDDAALTATMAAVSAAT